MAYTPTDWQDGVTPVNAVNMNKLEQGLAAAVGIPADVVVASPTAHLIRNRFNAGDTQPAFKLTADGRIDWGAGGAAAPDTALYRAGAGTLVTSGSFWVDGPFFGGTQAWIASPSLTAFAIGVYQSPGGVDEANDRWEVKGSGEHRWGPGGATPTDTWLARGVAHQLVTENLMLNDGALDVNPKTVVTQTVLGTWFQTENEYRFELDGNGKMKWGPGGATAPDAFLYRSGAQYLRMEAHLQITGNIYPDGSIVNNNQSLYSFVFSAQAAGDTGPRLTIQNSGHIFWGPGAGATDASLYRVGPGQLQMGAALNVQGFMAATGTVGANPTGAGAVAFSSVGGVPSSGYFLTFQQVGDAGWRFLMYADGGMAWGPGNTAAAPDTRLYRAGVGILVTDGAMIVQSLYSAGGIVVDNSNVGPSNRLFFGSALDTSLYRSAANVVKTDGTLEVGVGVKFPDASVQTTAATGPPPGTISMYAGAAAPAGYLLCDGSSQLRATYAALFAAIGTAYGSVDGTHFNLPDMQGRVAVGKGTHADVATLGNNDGVAVGNRRPKHNHTFTVPTINISDPGHTHRYWTETTSGGGTQGFAYSGGGSEKAPGQIRTGQSGGGAPPAGTAGVNETTGITASASGGAAGVGGTAAVDAPAYIVINYIIKT